MFKTRVTEILGVDYPLIVGTMQDISTGEFVAAAANAGAFACIASAMFMSKETLRNEIRKTKSLTDKPFGVNINLFPMLRPISIEEYIDTVIEEGVGVIETSGRSPEPYIDRIKKANVKLMHKCARVRDARTAERIGVDIVEIVGFECGGHPSMEEVTTLVLLPRVVDTVKIPVVGGGGFGDARGFVAALALGAEGVLMGTRFMAVRECNLHPNFKKAFVKANETDTVIVQRSLSDPIRVMRNKTALQVLEMEKRGTTLEELIPFIAGDTRRRATAEGDIDSGLMACGQVVGLIHDVPTMKEVVDSIINGAIAIYERLGKTLKPAG